ncbi:MAG: isochorismatase family protein [Desulforhopalus sp.]
MLCIIDMQNDFVDQQKGKMAVKRADKLIKGIIDKIDEYDQKGDIILYTINLHGNMDGDNRTDQEKNWGQEIVGPLKEKLLNKVRVNKTYHAISPEQMIHIKKKYNLYKYINNIELVGVESHICVLSTAVVFSNEFPNSNIMINRNLCLSSDMDLHNMAMIIMEKLKMEVTD